MSLCSSRCLIRCKAGARREMLETYIKRLEELERIANSFQGVENLMQSRQAGDKNC
jgi:HD superfamily phosphodiesterase